jgi:hypothetical protein
MSQTCCWPAVIRRWISEGAKNDDAESPCFEVHVPSVSLSSSAPLEISTRVLAPALLTLTLRSARPSRDLYPEEASVSMPRERANIAAPGEWIHWRLVREQGWPRQRLSYYGFNTPHVRSTEPCLLLAPVAEVNSMFKSSSA